MLVRQGLIKNSPFLTCKQICKVHFVYGQIDIKKFYKVKFNCLEIIKLQISRKAYSEKILKIYAYQDIQQMDLKHQMHLNSKVAIAIRCDDAKEA